MRNQAILLPKLGNLILKMRAPAVRGTMTAPARMVAARQGGRA